MVELSIERAFGSGFVFPLSIDDWKELKDKVENIKCSYCGGLLDIVYIHIIRSLGKKNLLPDNFKPACCGCYKEKQFITITWSFGEIT